MYILILESVGIFLIINIIEFIILTLLKVSPNFKAGLILNNILGIIMLFVIEFLNIFKTEINLCNIIITSSSGVIGLIYILFNQI